MTLLFKAAGGDWLPFNELFSRRQYLDLPSDFAGQALNSGSKHDVLINLNPVPKLPQPLPFTHESVSSGEYGFIDNHLYFPPGNMKFSKITLSPCIPPYV